MSNILAVKALNQYRKRDLLAYLGIRYYVNSSVGRKDRWIREVCTKLAKADKTPGYFSFSHYKDVDERGNISHREVFLPTPTEMLAETALIDEISRHDAFNPKPFVYSYRYCGTSDKSGLFKPYFEGLKERHKAIEEACERCSEGIVLYTDIKKFYPSISFADASRVWEQACENSELPEDYKELGSRILHNHSRTRQIGTENGGLLTGPLFSHIIANLILNPIDIEMNDFTRGNYFRYVDDIIMVGSKVDVENWRKILSKKCQGLGLELHRGSKDFQVSVNEWLTGRDDFNDSLGAEWISLISNIKRFLVANPTKRSSLSQRLQQNGIRIPILDYSLAAQDPTYLRRLRLWMRRFIWAKRSVRDLTVERIFEQAIECRDSYQFILNAFLDKSEQASPYQQKRLTPKVRFLLGRLSFLLDDENLLKLAESVDGRDDVHLLKLVAKAVSTGDFTEIVQMGPNATSAAAQIKSQDKSKEVFISHDLKVGNVEVQSLAILRVYGLNHQLNITDDSELLQLTIGDNIEQLFKSENKFIQEVACLHGSGKSRHTEVLETSFDSDESLAMDLLHQIHGSSGR